MTQDEQKLDRLLLDASRAAMNLPYQTLIMVVQCVNEKANPRDFPFWDTLEPLFTQEENGLPALHPRVKKIFFRAADFREEEVR